MAADGGRRGAKEREMVGKKKDRWYSDNQVDEVEIKPERWFDWMDCSARRDKPKGKAPARALAAITRTAGS